MEGCPATLQSRPARGLFAAGRWCGVSPLVRTRHHGEALSGQDGWPGRWELRLVACKLAVTIGTAMLVPANMQLGSPSAAGRIGGT